MAGYGEQCWEFLVGDDFNGAKIDGFEGARAAGNVRALGFPCRGKFLNRSCRGAYPARANGAGSLIGQAPRGVSRSRTETPPDSTWPQSAPPGRTVRRTTRIRLLVAKEDGGGMSTPPSVNGPLANHDRLARNASRRVLDRLNTSGGYWRAADPLHADRGPNRLTRQECVQDCQCLAGYVGANGSQIGREIRNSLG